MDRIPDAVSNELWKSLPGMVGALTALLLSRDVWVRKIPLFIVGSVAARFGNHDAARILGLDEGFAGFLLGVFGMAVLAKVFDVWTGLDLGPMLKEWLRSVLHLPPQEEK
ncbi:MAG TPA: hypothetical protein VJ323_09530 [Bryobacteraceae bacterium]|jgi:hypothetical protein|nr:hypothetical protein [Bryobacteraceae bacterium]